MCPNYNPLRWRDAQDARGDWKEQQVNVTARDSGTQNEPYKSSTAGPTKMSANTKVLSLSGRVQEVSKGPSAVAGTVPEAMAARNESVLCNITEAANHNFSLFQNTLPTKNWDQNILLDNQSTCHVFRN